MKRLTVIIVMLAALYSTYQGNGQAATYAPLQVFTNGPGKISPLHAGQMLEVWETYSMVATPETGFAFHNWEWLDVFMRITRITNGTGGISTNIQKTVTSKRRFFSNPELTFKVRPVFEAVESEVLTTVSMYGWRANFGPVREAVLPDAYQTVSGATVEERGDRVPNRRRVVPWSAELSFDFDANPPSLTAVMSNAVIEGGPPFSLTVRSYYGYQLANGSYRFSGDYLQDINPTGSQYGFDWQFSAPTNGRMVWNGTVGWFGGHLWLLSISNLALVQQAQLSLARVGPASFQAVWRTNFSNHALEYAPSFPAAAWKPVTNAVVTNANRLSVTVPTDESQRFYRLRQP